MAIGATATTVVSGPYERGPEIQTGYYERPLYRGYDSYRGDGYADGYVTRYRSDDYGHRGYGYRDYGYRDYGYRGGCGWHGCGYGYRSSGYGYDYPRYGYGYRPYYAPTVRYGGGWLQTAGALGYGGYGSGYGCGSAYIPYGWTWYRSTSC
jgi:hypothetical protein